MKYLITVLGPTAIGKTALSIQLAAYFDCEIVSCDSRQFFKEMTIGTAVPSQVELNSVPHHFIQNKSIFENYTVGDYEKEALAQLDELFKNKDYAVLVGGSGLYVNAILHGFDVFPAIDSKVRTQVQEKYDLEGLPYLQHQLEQLDTEYYTFLLKTNPQTLQNPQRMMRFIEVCLGTGKPYSSFLNQEKKQRNFIPILIGLETDREAMYQRINKRVDLMVAEGLVEEAQNLFEYKNLNALQTVGYRELFDYFEGKTTLEFAIEEIKKNTRRFAKRQMTWFKKTENVQWFDSKTDLQTVIHHIKTFSCP
ncbi:tRNA (adenosine(37)-N6)-dimethylallyltransferase MiaA [Flavobacterium sp.]|uniref:tRNA (adenosine(37)-N6)-dimethylallyltransferase MiaA n=1 Tax=Flavobacterium sp. TaxID=239 RepID=UPI00260AEAA9|nr:tRNA (adenosine(37)-N6)-dimethylallyltransferase MiaA [Flavobacterium sp.]MDD3003972.1 tRNA (adenosine(37)-N6)-dimethylallyltransferase MiaA [Flavobacterium sp.]